MSEEKPIIDAILQFLEQWQAREGNDLGMVLTAGQLVDMKELERLYALPSC